ncbi:metallophosphoesterase [Rhizobium sp. TRM95111]|uniref:metallophosphoesterase n=1 Tax=Rhizobium alarense TaxID=2846851 RepID=UPI001F343190|nr:metallophosphoesterase [Rhizobium alarense]MCF3638572.1 metallophosphoesterase [Rhizobium alarense]
MTDPARLPRFSFGLVADPQYAAIERHPTLDRFYARSLGKLEEAIAVFNGEDLAFVMTLGDVIDRGFESFDAVLGAYETLRHRAIFLPGNHDFLVEPGRLGEVHKRLGMPAPYHHFALGGVRFVVLDGNVESVFVAPPGDPRQEAFGDRLAAMKVEGAINAHIWNGGIGAAQFDWLEEVMDQAEADGEAVVVFLHYPLYPRNEHNLWDCEAVVELLTRYRCFRAAFSGHNHAGNYGAVGGQHFVNLKGMVETAGTNAFAVVDVFDDRLELRGFGREESRILAFGRTVAAALAPPAA